MALVLHRFEVDRGSRLIPSDSPSTARVVRIPLTLGILALTLTLWSGQPFWSAHPFLALLAPPSVGLLAVVGSILAADIDSRPMGTLLLVSSFACAFQWVGIRNDGVYPIIGEIAPCFFFLFLGSAALAQGRKPFSALPQKIWLYEAVIILPIGQVLVFLLIPADALGYRNGVVWPNIISSDRLFEPVIAIRTAADALLAVSLVCLLIWTQLKLQERRQISLVVLVGGSVTAVLSSLLESVAIDDRLLDGYLTIEALQMAPVVLLPLSILAAPIFSRWRDQVLATRLMRAASPPTHVALQETLRSIVGWPDLELWLWLPRKSCFVSIEGRVRERNSFDENFLVFSGIAIDNDAPLACFDSVGNSSGDSGEVRSILAKARPSLHAAQLQANLLEELRDIQGRLIEAEQKGRRELARNLHDGVQQHVAALKIDLNRVGRLQSLESMKREILECSTRTDSIIEDLRSVARGLVPPLLAEKGLASALEGDAERTGRRVQLDIPEGRLQPRIETLLYYALSEAMTNVYKHAEAADVKVRVQVVKNDVVAQISDDGIGGASMKLGGGLHGVDDRVRAARGRMTISSPSMGGTNIVITIPQDLP